MLHTGVHVSDQNEETVDVLPDELIDLGVQPLSPLLVHQGGQCLSEPLHVVLGEGQSHGPQVLPLSQQVLEVVLGLQVLLLLALFQCLVLGSGVFQNQEGTVVASGAHHPSLVERVQCP